MFKIIKWIIIMVVVVFVAGTVYSILTKKGEGPGNGGFIGTSGYKKGVSLSPKSFSETDFPNFFVKAKEAGDIVSWAGDWQELGNLERGGPVVVASLAKQYKYTPVIEAQFFTQSSGALLRPLNNTTKEDYKNNAANFAEKFKIPYLGLGIEINTLYEKSPQDFEDFAKFYNEVYSAVKAKSPKTKVFTVFQLEKMKGLNGGLFGGKNDPSKNEWSLLDKFPKSDIVAFTTYPGLIYKSPSEIPADYYSEIKSRVSKPIVFTEIGWHSALSPVGWESSETEQAEFVKTYFNITKDLNKEFDIWSFLYDQQTFEPFKSMGLYQSDGSVKEAWSAWISAKPR